MQEKNTTTPRVKTTSRGRSETRLALWEEHIKDPIVALDKALKCVCVCGKFVLEVSARVLGGRVSRDGSLPSDLQRH